MAFGRRQEQQNSLATILFTTTKMTETEQNNIKIIHHDDLHLSSSTSDGPCCSVEEISTSIPKPPPTSSLLSLTSTSTSTSIRIAIDNTPEELISFDWSDFPIIGQDNETSTVIITDNSCGGNCSNQYNNDTFNLSFEDVEEDSQHEQQTRQDCNEVSNNKSEEEQDQRQPKENKIIGILRNKKKTTTSQTTAINNNNHRRHVSFAKIMRIRTYDLIYGDHPCCRYGYPISLGLKYNINDDIEENLDTYEIKRLPYRRRGNELRLSVDERKNLLKTIGGYTQVELFLLEQDNRKNKQQDYYGINKDNNKSRSRVDNDNNNNKIPPSGTTVVRGIHHVPTLGSLINHS